MFPNSTYRNDETSNITTSELAKIAKDMGYTALFQLDPLEEDLGCILRVVSLAKGASAKLWCSNREYDLNSARTRLPVNTSLSECMGRMIQSFFINKVREDLDFTCLGNDCDFFYLIGGRVGTQGVEAWPRFLFKVDAVQMGTFETMSGKYERVSMPQYIGVESRR